MFRSSHARRQTIRGNGRSHVTFVHLSIHKTKHLHFKRLFSVTCTKLSVRCYHPVINKTLKVLCGKRCVGMQVPLWSINHKCDVGRQALKQINPAQNTENYHATAVCIHPGEGNSKLILKQ